MANTKTIFATAMEQKDICICTNLKNNTETNHAIEQPCDYWPERSPKWHQLMRTYYQDLLQIRFIICKNYIKGGLPKFTDHTDTTIKQNIIKNLITRNYIRLLPWENKIVSWIRFNFVWIHKQSLESIQGTCSLRLKMCRGKWTKNCDVLYLTVINIDF